VSIGILLSSLSNKKEFDSLKGTLKQMENLVQDLQDELEMKEGLTVNPNFITMATKLHKVTVHVRRPTIQH
jgi:hypothetical protein